MTFDNRVIINFTFVAINCVCPNYIWDVPWNIYSMKMCIFIAILEIHLDYKHFSSKNVISLPLSLAFFSPIKKIIWILRINVFINLKKKNYSRQCLEIHMGCRRLNPAWLSASQALYILYNLCSPQIQHF